ncbi:MAG: tRNA 2-selenouridine(34) synthase MnmH [Bacteroidota bacterium]
MLKAFWYNKLTNFLLKPPLKQVAFFITTFAQMAAEKINIEELLATTGKYPIIDVRSPGEFEQAHIPGAFNLPLFTNEERKIVGTAYKQQSRETAIKIGLDFFGPKMRGMVEFAEQLNSKTIIVHCWRGGMRSAAVAWLLDLYGFKVLTLAGGYKKFRHFVINTFSQSYSFNIVGGYTGSGKTELLQAMQQKGNSFIDLEALANHKGSAFGNLGMPPQPSQEHFENLLGMELYKITAEKKQTDPIWLEDESQRIGSINLPMPVWTQMRNAPLYFVDIPFEQRLDNICHWYGKQDMQKMIEAIIRIQKRLGGLETKTAIQLMQDGNIKESFRILLTYYDKYYNKSLQNRPDTDAVINRIVLTTVDAAQNCQAVLNQALQKQL